MWASQNNYGGITARTKQGSNLDFSQHKGKVCICARISIAKQEQKGYTMERSERGFSVRIKDWVG